MKKEDKFYKAWRYLTTCDYFNITFGSFSENNFGHGCLDIDVVKVNPETMAMDDNDKNNTKIQIWIETGNWHKESSTWCHDIFLDCGGDTFEDAIIELAKLVKKTN